jgi:membrane protein DedA with SNARE-associated domain
MSMDPLGGLIAWIASYGMADLLGLTLFERFLPVLPSYGLLVAVGIAAAEDAWSLPAALLTSIAGSLLGCVACYALGAALGEDRFFALLRRVGRLFGISQSRIARWTRYFRNNQAALVFGAQLVPTIRLIAPGIAGLLSVKAAAFIVASACGVALWNSVFIGVGYATSTVADTANASTVALAVLTSLLVGEGLAIAIWKRLRRRAGRAAMMRASGR